LILIMLEAFDERQRCLIRPLRKCMTDSQKNFRMTGEMWNILRVFVDSGRRKGHVRRSFLR
jgi:hypothetical protein